MALLIEPYDLATEAAAALQMGDDAVSAALSLVYRQQSDQFPDSWDQLRDFLTGTARWEPAQADKLDELLQAASDDAVAATSAKAVLTEPSMQAYFGPRVVEAAPRSEQTAPAQAVRQDASGGADAGESAWIAVGSAIYRSGGQYFLRQGTQVWPVTEGDESRFHDGAHYYDAMGRMHSDGRPAAQQPPGQSVQDLLGALTAQVEQIEGLELLSDREIEMIIGAALQETASHEQGQEQR